MVSPSWRRFKQVQRVGTNWSTDYVLLQGVGTNWFVDYVPLQGV